MQVRDVLKLCKGQKRISIYCFDESICQYPDIWTGSGLDAVPESLLDEEVIGIYAEKRKRLAIEVPQNYIKGI